MQNDILQVNHEEFRKIMSHCYEMRKSLLVASSPGIGKTEAITRFITDELKGTIWPFILSHRDTTDLHGVLYPNKETGKCQWFFPEDLPTDPKAKGALFFDEMANARSAVMNIAQEMLQSRRLETYRCPEDVVVWAATNSIMDRTGANRINSAVINRVLKVHLVPRYEDVENYALANDWASEVMGFLKFKPELLNTFDADTWTQDQPFATPRSWHELSKFIAKFGAPNIMRQEICGLIGPGAGIEFHNFLVLMLKVPDLDYIIANPLTAPVVQGDPSITWAVTIGLARKAVKENLDAIIKYLKRLPKEFEVFGVRDVIKKKSTLIATKVFSDWANMNAKYIVD